MKGIIKKHAVLQGIFCAELIRQLKFTLPVIISIFLVNVSLSGTVAESNLVGWWKFDEGSGTTASDSAGSHNGSLQGSPQWTIGKIGGGIDFNGVSGYIEIADDDSLTPSSEITIAFWLYNRGGKDAGIFKYAACAGGPGSPGRSRAYNIILRSATSLLQFTIFSAVDVYDNLYSDNTIETNGWHHIATTFDQGQAKIYVDGVPNGSKTMSVSSIMNDDNPLIFGGYWNYCETGTFAQRLNGILDDVRIYNKALSSEEINEIYREISYKASVPNPAYDATGVDPNVVLSWWQGKDADSHNVYLGTNFNDVNDANTFSDEYVGNFDTSNFDPCGLEIATTYFWRIDEVNEANSCIWKGDVWNFTTWFVFKHNINFPNDPFFVLDSPPGGPGWVKFTIKLDDPCTVYYQNSDLYMFHYDFATNWLEPFIGMSVPEYYDVTLYEPNQQAVLGAVLIPPLEGEPPAPTFDEYGIQFIRYDPYTKEEIADMFAVVKDSVIADPCVQAYYFPAYEQMQVAEENQAWFESQGIPIGSISRWIEGNICYSEGWALGELKYFPSDQIQAAYLNGDLLPEDILLTDGIPAEVPFVAGIICLSPTTPNSHMAILARTYGIPFVFLANASDIVETWQLVGRLALVCVFQVGGGCSVQLTDAWNNFTPQEIEDILALKTPTPLDITPMAVYGGYGADANNLLPGDIEYFGGKASNYGMLRTSQPDNCPVAVALSFDVWNGFLDQPLTPSENVIIDPCGYVVFWCDDETGQGPKHTSFKLSKNGEDIGLFDVDGTSLINGISFGAQTTDASYGRIVDGVGIWTFFYGGGITPNGPNPGTGPKPTEGLFINEFMADNDTIVADEHGEYDDWVEIYNAGPIAVDLGGMYLTDDFSDPTNFMIPAGITGSTLREEIANRLGGYTYPVSNLGALSTDLAAVRNLIINAGVTSFSPQLQNAVIAVLQDPNYGFDPDKKIRFRSSTNVEDSEKFTGAGLYDSYSGCLADDLDGDQSGPCACDAEESNERGVFRAIRKVFASFYNDNAFLERLRHGVDETEVGMALLVHHSFPDEFELANGVATMRKQPTQSHWDIELVTQKGATSVSNPVDGSIPEEVSVYADTGGGISMTLIRQSNLVILGETVMDWQEDYNDLTELLVIAAERFENVTGKTGYILDFEYKKVSAGGAAMPAGGLVVKQIREIPPLDSVSSTCPSVSYSCYCSVPRSYFVERSYEDPSGVSIETSYFLYCPADFCIQDELACWCRTVISGYTTKAIFLYTGYSQTYFSSHHNWCEDFIFTPHLEPGMNQCTLNQLRAQDIREIHLNNMTYCGTPYIETFGFGSGPYYLGDFEPDGDVDMLDFAKLAERWLDSDCGQCGGADLDCDEEVGFEDLLEFVNNWLAE